MKIKLSQIKIGKFTVRDDIENEYLKELKDSFKKDGQWDPIIVRPSDGDYELVSGHTRFQAAKEIGWNDLEATVRDLTDEEADILALKTNLMRSDMSEEEEGKVIQRYIERYKLSQREIAEKVGKSQNWVNDRLNLVMKLTEYVKSLISKKLITPWQASFISGLKPNEQDEFAKFLVENKIPAGRPTEEALKRFKNKTIFTIGYAGKSIDEFIKILKENNIDHVIDIRASDKSKEKPEFNGEVLKRSLNHEGIKYEHYPELGVHFVVQQPYKTGYFKLECFKQWYQWNIDTMAKDSPRHKTLEDIIEHLKDIGKCALMCMEQYAKPLRNQEYHCHRDILADMILKTEIFSERIDL